MNLILLSLSEIHPLTQRVRLTGRRHQHVLEVLKPKVNESLCVGVENGRMGNGRVVGLDAHSVELEIGLTADPPAKLPVTLCLALMRPIVLKRVLQTAASMGVGRIILFHSRRVEKSFWQSTALRDNEIHEQLVLGLEQARDTVIPTVEFHKRFKPFVEDVLPQLLNREGRGEREDRRMTGQEAIGIAADPSGESFSSLACQERRPGQAIFPLLSSRLSAPKVLILGPEGGFIPYEIEKFKDAGCRVVGLGDRILKVETAMAVLLGKMF